ncbi:protein of unknown function [Xenorhabdus poinarii G6]|uniref:Uncharacterized protein n=1 Tax=Xenorhabdus poinarii G6 TaxID=1354304 RepID=A0A068R1F7_9GAMM|nr:hypothetical protein [Xenorhabdus poinarii]CDG21023.1 protein of unknown function [Xenorhabdus poinarii G6]
MRQFDCDPGWMQDEAEERRREEAAYQDAVEADLREEAEETVLGFIDNPLSEEANKILGPIFKSNPAAWDVFVAALDAIVMMDLKDKSMGRTT